MKVAPLWQFYLAGLIAGVLGIGGGLALIPSSLLFALVSMFLGGFFAVLMVVVGIGAHANKLATSTTTTKPTEQSGLEAELKRLNDLKARGVIDDAEYKRLRENLISRT